MDNLLRMFQTVEKDLVFFNLASEGGRIFKRNSPLQLTNESQKRKEKDTTDFC